MSSDAQLPDLDEVRGRHFGNIAPAAAQAQAVARFRGALGGAAERRNLWPTWGVAVAIVCAILLIPNVIRNDEPASDVQYGVAGLSLTQLDMPPRPSLAPGRVSTSELSATTNLSLGLPNGIPNLSQLSAPRIEVKETI